MAGLVGKKLDLDRLGNRGQITNQVLYQLGQFDIKTGHLLFDLAANFVHDASIGGRGTGFSRMKKSPSLASVMPPPNWVPVRRE